MKPVESPWAELFGKKEEKSLLFSLRTQKWQPEACYSLLKEILNPLVQSLHFNSHSRWGLQIDSQEIRTLSMGFMEWMQKTNAWIVVENRVLSRTPSSSLRVSLSRAFVRYQAASGLKTLSEREPSFSAKRSMLELPESHYLSQISGAAMDAFTSLTSQLPEELRLPYQLHLEGLVDSEIAALLQIESEEINLRIQQAKSYLKEPTSWKRAS